jgi:glycine reductase
MRVVHYLNQFFGGLGGEEKAGASLETRPGPVGPGLALQNALGPNSEVVLTVICGDNYAAERLESGIVGEVIAKVREAGADLFVAGPCFEAGRYGIAAGALCAGVQTELGIPAVSGMALENPGVDLYRREAYIIDSGQNLAQMSEVLGKMVRLGTKLVNQEPIGLPRDEEYHLQGWIKSEFGSEPSAERLADMIVALVNDEPWESEVPTLSFEPVPMPPAVPDLSKAKIAIVTDGGLVPSDNPDNMPRAFATVWGAYDIAGRDGLEAGHWEVAHGGYDNRPVLQDPNRLVPVDVLREFEKAGTIGELHKEFLATTGNGNPLENSRRLGREMAQRLKDATVDAVVLTST